MWRTQLRRERVIRALKYLGLLTLLLAPIAVYVWVFGTTLSTDHERWAQMGSAMSGIYGPVLAFLGYRLLTVQLTLQEKAMMLQERTTRHMFDQAYLARTSEDIAFYLEKLEEVLDQPIGAGKTLTSYVTEHFALLSREQLDETQTLTNVSLIVNHYPKALIAWNSIMTVFAGLKAVDEEPFRLHLGSAQQRAGVAVSWITCMALDHCAYTASEGRTAGPYLFSPHLQNYSGRS